MGYLTARFDGKKLPVKITKVNRNVAPEISNKLREIESVSGAEFAYSKYKEKSITIEYVINNQTARQLSDFRRSMAGVVHSKKPKRLIFSDEPYLYYEAILSGEAKLDENYLQSTGEMTFVVPVGLAHSTVEKTFRAALNAEGIMEAVIVNEGTEDVPVSYEIKHNHENGYIGIVSEHGAMQYGYIEEPDTEVRQKSQVLLNYKEASDFGRMTVNSGKIIPGTIPQNGSFKTVDVDGKKWLALDDPGNNPNYWAGASKCMTLPADSSGHIGSKNFILKIRTWFETGVITQTGLIYVALADSSNKEIAMINLQKFTTGNNTAECYMQVEKRSYKCIRWEPGYWSATNKENGMISIQKQGGLFEFTFGEQRYRMQYDELAEKEVTQVIILLGQILNRGTSHNALVSRMYIGEMMFRSDAVDYAYDIPNRYSEGSVCVVDGDTGKFYVDGVPSLEDERKGTRYFKVPPGETKVLFTCSEFSDPPPKVTAKIREAYL